MEFKKIQCSGTLAPIECINPKRDRWAVRWNHQQEEGESWTALEAVTEGKPTKAEVETAISKHIDEETQQGIINGFVWNDKPVKLTDSTQRNFLFAAYSLDHTGEIDRAEFSGILAATTDAEAADELRDIVAAMWQHIKTQRRKGINRKSEFDFSQFDL